MKLVMYNSLLSPKARAFDNEVIQLFSSKTNIKATLITDNIADYSEYFSKKLNFATKNIVHLNNIKKHELEIFESDLIIIDGKDPINVIKILEEANFMAKLRKFAQTKDKILIGSGAGSVVMTPKALGLVKFEVFPNYSNLPTLDNEIIEYSKSNNRPIYSLSEGDAIIINETREYMKGSIYLFSKGQKMQVSCNC